MATREGRVITGVFVQALYHLLNTCWQRHSQSQGEALPPPDPRIFVCLRFQGPIGGELYESVGVEAPILLSYTHKNEWNTHGGPPTRCQRSAMGVSLICVGVRQQNGCFDTHTFIQFST